MIFLHRYSNPKFMSTHGSGIAILLRTQRDSLFNAVNYEPDLLETFILYEYGGEGYS